MDTYCMCKIGHSQMTKQKNARQFIYINPQRQPEGEGTSTEEDDIQKLL
jgi:hypothetical protein